MNAWRSFLSQYPVKKFDKGQMIICQDTDPNCCYIISKGFVKTYLITNEGTEKPISFEGKNDIFPEEFKTFLGLPEPYRQIFLQQRYCFLIACC